MIQLILDASDFDISRPYVWSGLEADLRRIERLVQRDVNKPSQATALKIEVTNGIYLDSLNYCLQYGFTTRKKFTPLGERKRYSHETLPYLD